MIPICVIQYNIMDYLSFRDQISMIKIFPKLRLTILKLHSTNKLHYNYNNLKILDLTLCCMKLPHIRNLRVLKLKSSNIILNEGFHNLQSLVIKDSNINYVPESIDNLYVEDEKFNHNIEHLTKLRSLTLLYPFNKSYFPRSLTNCELVGGIYYLNNLTKLINLNVSHSTITKFPPNAETMWLNNISADMRGLTNLKTLDLTECNIDYLPQSITRLSISRCNITITDLPHLRELYLRDTNIYGSEIPKKIRKLSIDCDFIDTLRHLTELDELQINGPNNDNNIIELGIAPRVLDLFAPINDNSMFTINELYLEYCDCNISIYNNIRRLYIVHCFCGADELPPNVEVLQIINPCDIKDLRCLKSLRKLYYRGNMIVNRGVKHYHKLMFN